MNFQKRLTTRPIVLFSFLVMAAYSYAEQAQDTRRDFSFPHGRSFAEIPFELNSNKIYLRVCVNNFGPFWFVLDTGGATGSLFDEKRAESVGMNRYGFDERRMGLGDKPISFSLSDGVLLSLPGFELHNQRVMVMPLSRVLSAFEGRAFEGTLGYNLFSHVVVEIDYVSSRVRFYDPAVYQYSGSGTVIPLGIASNQAHVWAKIVPFGGAPIEGDFIVDTGARVALLLYTSFVNKHKLLGSQRTIYATVGAGLGGEARWHVGRIQSVQLGDITTGDVVAGFSQATSGLAATTRHDGIIGAEFLKRFKVIFNYSRQRLILEKTGLFDMPMNFDMSGMFLIAEGPHLKRFRVLRVLENSPATEAGVQAGDVITAIDARLTRELTLEGIRQLLVSQEGRKFLLTVRRGNREIQIPLKLRRLI